MKKQITICGESKDELIQEALEVVEMLSGVGAATATSDEDDDEVPEPKTPAKPKGKRGSKKAASKKPKVTKDELRAAVQAAIKEHGEPPVKEVFAKHDVMKLSDIKATQFAAILTDVKLLDELADDDDDDDDDGLGLDD